jgi:hypothetical protein
LLLSWSEFGIGPSVGDVRVLADDLDAATGELEPLERAAGAAADAREPERVVVRGVDRPLVASVSAASSGEHTASGSAAIALIGR